MSFFNSFTMLVQLSKAKRTFSLQWYPAVKDIALEITQSF